MFNNKYLKTKAKSHNTKIATNLNNVSGNNKVAKGRSECICLSAIGIDPVFKSGKNYYPQTYLEECKYRER